MTLVTSIMTCSGCLHVVVFFPSMTDDPVSKSSHFLGDIVALGGKFEGLGDL